MQLGPLRRISPRRPLRAVRAVWLRAESSACYDFGVTIEPQLVQTLGTFVTILGLVVVAPRAAGRVLPSLWRGVLSVVAALQGRRASVTVAGPPDQRRLIVAQSTDWNVESPDNLSHDERLARLEQAVTDGQVEASRLKMALADLDARTAARYSELEGRSSDLQRHVQEGESRQEHLNSRGFPLAAMGALLAGTPCWFATWWWLPLFLLVIGVGLRWLFWDSRSELLAGWNGTD